MKINAIQCPKCNDIIFSRTTHDYRSCTCESTAIDGGFDYCKVAYNPNLPCPKTVQLDIEISKEDLYQDWNKMIDKYGLIKGEPNGNV